MKFEKPIPIQEIADKIGAEIIGDNTLLALGINEIHKVQKGDITFVDVAKYFDKSLYSAASIIILNEKVDCPPGKALLYCDQPFKAYNKLAKEHRPKITYSSSISDTAEIDPTAIIEPNVFIGDHVKIGAHTLIQSNTSIYEYTEIGSHVIIQSGAMIGNDAFYFKKSNDTYEKWRSTGRVIIKDHADIGACTTVNRGVSGDTIIGMGTKIDCHVHIAHGAVIGDNCLIAAQVGIAGKAILQDGVVLYGQVGVIQNVVIGEKAVVMAQSGVGKSLEGGKVYFGSPCKEARVAYKEVAALRQLPDLLKKL